MGFPEFTKISTKGPAPAPQSEVPANERGRKRDLAAPLQKSLSQLFYKSNKRTDILSPSPATSYLSLNSVKTNRERKVVFPATGHCRSETPPGATDEV